MSRILKDSQGNRLVLTLNRSPGTIPHPIGPSKGDIKTLAQDESDYVIEYLV